MGKVFPINSFQCASSFADIIRYIPPLKDVPPNLSSNSARSSSSFSSDFEDILVRLVPPSGKYSLQKRSNITLVSNCDFVDDRTFRQTFSLVVYLRTQTTIHTGIKR